MSSTPPFLARDAAQDRNAYFDALVNLPSHWRSYSLRDQRQLLLYKHASSLPPSVNYDAEMDAAKVVIPAFQTTTTLAEPLDQLGTVVRLTVGGTQYPKRVIKIDGELIAIASRNPDGSFNVTRGAAGTAATPHAAGASVAININSLPNQVRLPLGTSDGHTYFFVWDGMWNETYLKSGLSNHKAFQFSVGKETLWLEPQTRFDGGSNRITGFDTTRDVAAVEVRAYLATNGPSGYTDPTLETGAKYSMGPGVTSDQPISPMSNKFAIRANKHTRFFVRIEQRANDYDYMDFWVADEDRDPVQIYNRIPLSVKNASQTIDMFWLEFNTSTSSFTRSWDLESYVWNFVALQDPGEVTALLQRPAGGLPIPSAPRSPRNLRVVP